MHISQLAGRAAVGVLLLAAGVPAAGAAQGTATTPAETTRTPDVIFVPTPVEVVDQMLRVARVGKDDLVYDLGCGDGRIPVTAAKRFGARGVCIDIDPARIRDSRQNVDSSGVAELVEIRQADLFEVDLSDATVVTLYLLPELNIKLRPKLFEELRPGTRIVSHDFDMGDWQPDSVMKVPNSTRGESTVYYWVLPADVAGRWTLTTSGPESAGNGGERRYVVRFKQQYQRLTGTATRDGRALPIEDARMVGERIAFTVRDTVGDRPAVMRFSGRVSGKEMSGTVTTEGGVEQPWSATRSPGKRAAAPRPSATVRG
jgi:hypothetical protein